MRSVINSFFVYIGKCAGEERPRLILWSPLAVMSGIYAYFALPGEPPAYTSFPLLTISFGFLWFMRKRQIRVFAWALFLSVLGFSAAQARSYMVATPLLPKPLTFRVVEGIVDEIEPGEKRTKLVLFNLQIEDLPTSETPRRVRISIRDTDSSLKNGDRIRVTANLYPLPGPAMPGAYDFARHFYFRSIGGNGFAMRPPEIIEISGQQGFNAWLGDLRHHIGEDMREHIAGGAGAVAAAMTVSETGPIPETVNESLRNSGLAHMLSISGLHLGIAAGIMFYAARLLLALWPPLALRVPVKKIAAMLALTSAFVYLCLSGSPVPAQRSFIMVAFLFSAVLLDRRAVTLRTLAIAALIILLVFPESMFGPSFQMSFAATLAIVALYETFSANLSHGGAWPRRLLYYFFGIAVTSLAATLATAPFVLYHFNRFALFGLISNMLVIPLATFTIMPGIALALIFMPFGWQALGYAPLELGVRLMISFSDWINALPYASPRLPAPSDAGLVLCAFGLMWLCLMTQRWRLLGIAFIMAGLSTMGAHQPPDLIAGEDGRQVMARLEDGRYTMLKGSPRSFKAQSWLRAQAQEEFVPLKASEITCDKTLCDYHSLGKHILVVKKPWDEEALKKACAQPADLLLAWWYLHRDECPSPRLLIGREELEHYGAHMIWLEPAIRLKRVREDERRRLWQPEADETGEEADDPFS